MKITGPSQPPVSGTPGAPESGGSGSEGVGSTSRVADATAPDAKKTSGAGKAFAEKLAGTTPAQTAPGTAARRPGEISVQDLAADLKAGKLDARSAVDKVIDRVVNVQLGQNAPAQLREQVQTALRDALESDPLLADKLRSLG